MIEMVEHKMCLLTWALSYIGHVNDIGKYRSLVKVNGEQDL